MLAAEVHIGSKNLDPKMERYVWKRRQDGVHLIDLGKTWDKLVLAARVIAGIEHPSDICIISGRTFGQRAVHKFAHFTGATAIAGRFTPGTFTNQQQQRDFKEPRLLVVADPRIDHQVSFFLPSSSHQIFDPTRKFSVMFKKFNVLDC